MRTYLLLITILLISLVATAQVKKPSTKTAVPVKTGVYAKKAKKATSNHGTFTDKRDGHQYKWVKIGRQVWMAENLSYFGQHLFGGEVGSDHEPFSYLYDFDGIDDSDGKAKMYAQQYGVLYNWPAAKLACPQGWHLPTDAEWDILINYLGGKEVAGGKMRMAGTTYWNSSNEFVTNSSGFSALPGGYRDCGGTFYNVGDHGYWWSATENDTYGAWSRYMKYNLSNVFQSLDNKSNGFSVRCVRDY